MRTGKLLIKVILLGLICLVPFVSCKYDIHRFFFRGPRIDDRAASLKQLPPPFAQKNGSIQFAIITDLHFGSKRDRSEAELIQSLKNAEPLDFIVLLGDVVETGFDSYFSQCEDFIKRLRGFLGKQDLPVYVVLGNHDLYYDGYDRWQKLDFSWNKGEPFFRFETEVFDSAGNSNLRSWYFLDTASGMVGTSQLENLTKAMKSDKNPKMVFSHYPIYIDRDFSTPFKLSDPRERATLVTLFDKNGVDMVFSGHWHEGGFFDFGKFSELCCASLVENSKDESCWYVLALDETTKQLSIERFSVHGGKTSSTLQSYSLGG